MVPTVSKRKCERIRCSFFFQRKMAQSWRSPLIRSKHSTSENVREFLCSSANFLSPNVTILCWLCNSGYISDGSVIKACFSKHCACTTASKVRCQWLFDSNCFGYINNYHQYNKFTASSRMNSKFPSFHLNLTVMTRTPSVDIGPHRSFFLQQNSQTQLKHFSCFHETTLSVTYIQLWKMVWSR